VRALLSAGARAGAGRAPAPGAGALMRTLAYTAAVLLVLGLLVLLLAPFTTDD
jgi:hypothetical protein